MDAIKAPFCPYHPDCPYYTCTCGHEGPHAPPPHHAYKQGPTYTLIVSKGSQGIVIRIACLLACAKFMGNGVKQHISTFGGMWGFFRKAFEKRFSDVWVGGGGGSRTIFFRKLAVDGSGLFWPVLVRFGHTALHADPNCRVHFFLGGGYPPLFLWWEIQKIMFGRRLGQLNSCTGAKL